MICINLMTSGMHKTLESRRFRDSNREQASRLACLAAKDYLEVWS